MRIMAVAFVEDDTNVRKQILKQTIIPDEVHILKDTTPARSINLRRKRIAKAQEDLKKIVIDYEPDLVWQLEGDGDLPENCLERLVGHFIKNNDVAYISGIEVSRHGLYCLGAWRNITPNSFESIDHTLKGLQEVEATGLYCLLAPTHKWLSGKASWDGEPYGPDVTWGLSIDGKKYVDMGLEIGHIVKSGIIRPSNPSTCTAYFKKNTDGEWKYKTT